MLTDIPGLRPFLVVLALVPAIVCWWQGRRLRGMADDGALAERLMAARQRNGAVFGVVLVLLLFASAGDIWWTLPLTTLALLSASHPQRVALFEETWSLRTFVWFSVRLFAGLWGFWILLVIMPLLASKAGRADWAVGAVLAAVLGVWNARYATFLRWIVRAVRIEQATLLVRFVEMVRRAGIETPRFDRVDLRGGAVANAVALPSLNGSGVLFSGPLLERLTDDELVAICAHELAHLEHFNRRRLQRLYIANLAFIATGAALTPLSRLAGLSSNLVPLALWLAALLAEIAWRARDRQRNETASDLRAVELCGNPEALISGLTRLYTLGRIPRRLEAAHERHATHPSLARRIRDIRAAAGTAAAAIAIDARFDAADGRAAVRFDTEKLHWHEGDSIVHTIGYASLAELRIQVRGARPASLLAVEAGGRRWSMPLRPEDVAGVQRALDSIDARLPEPAAVRNPVWPAVHRLVLWLGALVALSCGYVAMAVVTLIALLQPAAPLLAAAGLASLTAAGLLVRGGGWNPAAGAELAFVFALLGLGLLLAARRKRHEEVPRRTAIGVGALGALAAASALLLVVSGVDPVRLHQAARSSTAAPILLLAFAGALTAWRSRTARYAAVPVVAMAAATTAAASATFLDRFGRDPFLAPAPPFEWRTIETEPDAEFSLPFHASSIRLAPGGRSVAIAPNPESDGARTRFRVGTPGAALIEVVADELLFADEAHLLLSEGTRHALEIRYARADRPHEILWRTEIADLLRESISYEPADRRWRVLGWDQARERIVRVEGVIGEAGLQRTEWPTFDQTSGYTHSLAAAGGEALFVENRYETGLMPRHWGWTWWLFPPEPETWFRIASSGSIVNLATSRIDARCHTNALSGGRLLCSGYDGTRTRFIGIDPATRSVAGVAWLDGQFVTTCEPSPGWVCGWLNGSAIALHPERGEALRFAGRGGRRAFEIAAADGVAATLDYDANGSIVRVYSIR